MSHLSSNCKSPSSCGNDCRCGHPAEKMKVLRVATMKGKTSKTSSIAVPKPTMKGFHRMPDGSLMKDTDMKGYN